MFLFELMYRFLFLLENNLLKDHYFIFFSRDLSPIVIQEGICNLNGPPFSYLL